jgi:phage terminase small subunit
MPVLKNPKRELYCQAIVKGLNQTQAAISAGFSAKPRESARKRRSNETDGDKSRERKEIRGE